MHPVHPTRPSLQSWTCQPPDLDCATLHCDFAAVLGSVLRNPGCFYAIASSNRASSPASAFVHHVDWTCSLGHDDAYLAPSKFCGLAGRLVWSSSSGRGFGVDSENDCHSGCRVWYLNSLVNPAVEIPISVLLYLGWIRGREGGSV